MLELEDTTEAPRLLRDKNVRLYRRHPLELRRIRAGEARGEGDPPDPKEDEDELYEMSICSDAGIERYDWWTGERFLEVLSLKPGALVSDYLDNNAAFLLDHDPKSLIGAIKDWRIDGKKDGEKRVRVATKWSRNAIPQAAKQDVDDEIRTHTSIGYEVLAWEQTKKGDREKGEMDEYTVTSWRIFEASLVSIPADITVGVGRSRARFRGLAGYDDGKPVTEDRLMVEPTVAAVQGGGAAPPAVTVEETRKAERERSSAILELGRVHGMAAEAETAVREGATVDSFRGQILAAIATKGSPQPPAEAQRLGIPSDLGKRYSYLRGLRKFLEARQGLGKFDGAEREVHDALVAKLPPNVQRHNGFMVPLIANEESYYARQERAMDSKTAGKGAELIVEQVGELIELLQNRTVVLRRGAQLLTGLTAPIAFPKQTGDMTFYWLPENGAVAVTGSDIALGLSLFTPKTLMGKGTWSRQLMMLGNLSVEQMFRNSIAGGHGRAIDRAAIHGKGSDGQPTGIYLTPGISTVAMGSATPTFGLLIDMQGKVADKNADEGALGYITTPLMAAKEAQTLKASAAGSEMNWVGSLRDGLLAGIPASSTGQVSKTMSGLLEAGSDEHGVVHGNFNDVLIGSWSGLEITVDELTQADYALLVIRSYGMEDVLVRHPESFCVSTAADLT